MSYVLCGPVFLLFLIKIQMRMQNMVITKPKFNVKCCTDVDMTTTFKMFVSSLWQPNHGDQSMLLPQDIMRAACISSRAAMAPATLAICVDGAELVSAGGAALTTGDPVDVPELDASGEEVADERLVVDTVAFVDPEDPVGVEERVDETSEKSLVWIVEVASRTLLDEGDSGKLA